MSLLTPAQRQALEQALAMPVPTRSRSEPFRVSDRSLQIEACVVGIVGVPTHETLATWLLAADDRVRAMRQPAPITAPACRACGYVADTRSPAEIWRAIAEQFLIGQTAFRPMGLTPAMSLAGLWHWKDQGPFVTRWTDFPDHLRKKSEEFRCVLACFLAAEAEAP